MVVIGQKSAIANVIGWAGMMERLQPDINNLTGTDKSQLQKISQKVMESGSYFSVTLKAATVKSEYENRRPYGRQL